MPGLIENTLETGACFLRVGARNRETAGRSTTIPRISCLVSGVGELHANWDEVNQRFEHAQKDDGCG
jgi:hypothetical protein